MARLDWKRFRDEEPKVGARIIRALYDMNRKNVHGLRTITYYVDTWTSGADIQKLRDWEREHPNLEYYFAEFEEVVPCG